MIAAKATTTRAMATASFFFSAISSLHTLIYVLDDDFIICFFKRITLAGYFDFLPSAPVWPLPGPSLPKGNLMLQFIALPGNDLSNGQTLVSPPA